MGKWSRAPVVVVVDGRLTRGNDQVLGHDLAVKNDGEDPAVLGDPQLDLAADMTGRGTE